MLVVPSPTSPKPLSPAVAAPAVVKAHECQPPMVTDAESVRVPTRCGVPWRRSMVPIPSSPWRFSPQHHRLPLVLVAQVWL